MRLQSLDRAKQRHVIIYIGRHGLSALGQALDQKRFNKFIKSYFYYLKFRANSDYLGKSLESWVL